MKKILFLILFGYPAIAMDTSSIQQAVTKYENDDPSKHPLYNPLYTHNRTEQCWLTEEKPKIIKAIKQNGVAVINNPNYGTTGHTPLCNAIEGHDFRFFIKKWCQYQSKN